MENNGVFCFISICKFGSFKNLFATITSLSELYFRIRRFILLVQTKKVISMNYGSSTSSWKPWRWMRLDLIFSMRDMYINYNLNPLTKFTSSSRSIKFKDILPWNICQINTNAISTSLWIVKLCNETVYPILSLMESQRKLIRIRISQWKENHCRTNTSTRRNK